MSFPTGVIWRRVLMLLLWDHALCVWGKFTATDSRKTTWYCLCVLVPVHKKNELLNSEEERGHTIKCLSINFLLWGWWNSPPFWGITSGHMHWVTQTCHKHPTLYAFNDYWLNAHPGPDHQLSHRNKWWMSKRNLLDLGSLRYSEGDSRKGSEGVRKKNGQS